jgi:hypothetical protein
MPLIAKQMLIHHQTNRQVQVEISLRRSLRDVKAVAVEEIGISRAKDRI